MILPAPLTLLILTISSCKAALAAPVESAKESKTEHQIHPHALHYRNEAIMKSNRIVGQTFVANSPSHCFRPVISSLTSDACKPVLDAIRTLKLADDDDGPPDKQKTWKATTKTGPIYHWGVQGNKCKIKVVVDSSLGPNVVVKDSFSKEDVWRVATGIVEDCVQEGHQAGRRPLGKKGLYVIVGKMANGEVV
ncbi:hypothetical protein Q9189_005512 [Teloschistes chrysophthalmus]